MKNALSLTMIAAALAVPTATFSATASDGDFSSWTTVEVFNFSPSVGKYAGSVYLSAGNPGASFLSNVIDGSGTPGVRAANVNNNYANTANIAGDTWTMTFDASNGPTGTPFQGMGLAIRQGSKYWMSGASVVPSNPGTSGTTWTHYTVTGSFTSGSFINMIGAGNPDFSGATPTYFGFYAYVQGGPSSPYQLLIDNYSISSAHLSAPVPEPASLLMMGAGALGLLLSARRRRVRTQA